MCKNRVRDLTGLEIRPPVAGEEDVVARVLKTADHQRLAVSQFRRVRVGEIICVTDDVLIVLRSIGPGGIGRAGAGA